MDEVKRFVGIDVAKAALDVFIGSAGAAFSVANDEVGIRELLRQLKPADFVILEHGIGGQAHALVKLKHSLLYSPRKRRRPENSLARLSR